MREQVILKYSAQRYTTLTFLTAATLTIGVSNVNDNPPVFVADTLEDKSIRENTPVNQLIGYVVATDPDNLNSITYTIE
jgi:uncharacterized protein (UPF0297 family)